MKVNEIVREERLDEIGPAAIPILGGLTWGGVLGAVSLFLTTISVIDLYNIFEKNNYDIRNMTDEQWKDVYLDLILLAVPGAGKFTKQAIRKLIPDSWLSSAAKRAKTQITSKLGSKTKDPRRSARIKKAADAKFEKLASNVKSAFNTIGISSIVITYYSKLSDLEDQYEAAKAGDKTTEIFGDSNPSELLTLADQQRKKLLGEATLSIIAVLGALTGAKATKAMSTFFGSTKGTSIVGGILSIPLAGVGRLLKIGAASWPLLLQTEAGQQFLANNTVRFLSTTAGTLVAGGIELLLKGIDEVGKRIGVDTTGVTGAMQSTISKDKAQAATQAAAGSVAGAAGQKDPQANIPSDLRLEKDPQNPKILYIGGVQVTDAEGFQSVGNQYKQMLSTQARGSKVPDPTVNLKPKPGVNYNY